MIWTFIPLNLHNINSININKSKEVIENDFKPLSDMRSSSKYRKIISQSLMERFYLEVKNNNIDINNY